MPRCCGSFVFISVFSCQAFFLVAHLLAPLTLLTEHTYYGTRNNFGSLYQPFDCTHAGTFLGYKSRDFIALFNESKWLALCMLNNMQSMILLIPLFSIVGGDPNVSYLIKVLATLLCDFSVVCYLFGPKMYYHMYGIKNAPWEQLSVTSVTSKASPKTSVIPIAPSKP